jgi:hypothetical protein
MVSPEQSQWADNNIRWSAPWKLRPQGCRA